MIRFSIHPITLWLTRLVRIVMGVAGLYFGLFFAWLTASPGTHHERLYARRAELWLGVTAVATLCLVRSFVIPRRRSRADWRNDDAARLG
jgi:hypothetical protein